MTREDWVCEICGQSFEAEVDLLAHQFNSSCEKDLVKMGWIKDNQEFKPDKTD